MKHNNIPTIRITGQQPNFSAPNTGGGGGNHFVNWTGGNSGSFGSSGSSFMPSGLVPNIHNVSTGSGFGSSAASSFQRAVCGKYSETEVLGTVGNTAKIGGGNNNASVWHMIEFCHKKSSDCWGSNALKHGAGGADGPYHVKAINIGWCDVDDNDIANFFYVLRDFNFDMDMINVAGNKITDYGVACIVNGITCINNQTLYSAANGWKPYLGPMKTVQHVKYLNLSGNNIGDQGAKVIADALAAGKLSSTRKIDISSNHVTPKGETALVKALKGVGQDIAVFTQTLDEIVKMSGDEGKEAQVKALKHVIERGKAVGTYDKTIVVDKSFLGKINNSFKNIEIGVDQVFGFGKCHLLPEPKKVVESYAQDKIIATLPTKTASGLSFAKKYVGKLLSFHDIVTCFVASRENALTSELGQEVTKHELCVIGEHEFCGE